VVGAIYVQLILGALMRHTGSGLAVPDFPLAYGRLFPSLAPDAVAQYNSTLIADNIRLAADGPVTGSQIIIHLFHRFWAVVTGVLVIAYAVRVLRAFRLAKGLYAPALALFALIPVQITLGAYTVLSRKAVDITTLHVATGALILMTTVVTTLKIYRLSPHPKREPAAEMNVKEAVA
jgi:cytochrome c oxidase assembly protein subunit 15